MNTLYVKFYSQSFQPMVSQRNSIKQITIKQSILHCDVFGSLAMATRRVNIQRIRRIANEILRVKVLNNQKYNYSCQSFTGYPLVFYEASQLLCPYSFQLDLFTLSPVHYALGHCICTWKRRKMAMKVFIIKFNIEIKVNKKASSVHE